MDQNIQIHVIFFIKHINQADKKKLPITKVHAFNYTEYRDKKKKNIFFNNKEKSCVDLNGVFWTLGELVIGNFTVFFCGL